MFIIDFDNSLLNTSTDKNSFKDLRVRALGEFGVSEKLYQETYRLARHFQGEHLSVYSDENHARVLMRYGFDREQVLTALQKTMGDNLKTFLFPGTVDFLEALKKLGQPMILFSLGDPEFQYLKVKGCGIEKYFDRVFFDSRPKQDIIHELLDKVQAEEIWFINDKVGETQLVLSAFPRLKAVLKISANNTLEDYQESGLPHFKTLIEIQEYILKNK